MAPEPLRLQILAATRELTQAGVASAGSDAQELAAHLLGVPRTRLGLQPPVEPDWVATYRALVRRRASRVPLQYLTGTAVLGRTTVEVGPGVFIPRPETEMLVEWVLDAVSAVRAPVVVDLCSGTGVIALAIAEARPEAVVYAVERSPAALAWARRNLDRHLDAGGTPIELRAGNVTDRALLEDLDAAADLVTANPPYVPSGAQVEPEVSAHDPAEAVFAGEDGLELIRTLIPVAAGLLKPGGVLAVEHDDSHGESVPALLRARGVLAEVKDHRDLNGRPRFATARRIALPPRAAAGLTG